MKSSRSRSRSKGNRNRSNNQGGNVVNRVFDSSGPEGKVRGTPQQIIEKYNQLARDAQLSNDRVAAENFQQHAEHYLRLLSEAQREMESRREEQERQNRERQAERDRERAERQEREANNAPSEAAAQTPEETTDVESTLVETPESQPKPKKQPRRKPRQKQEGDKAKKDEPVDEAAASSKDGAGDTPEAPEAAE